MFFHPLGEDPDGHHRVFAIGAIHLNFSLPQRSSAPKVAVLSMYSDDYSGHIAWYAPTTDPSHPWSEFPSNDPDYGEKGFIQIATWARGFRQTQTTSFQVKRVDSISQALYDKQDHPDRPRATPGFGLLQTNSNMYGADWTDVEVNGGLYFDYSQVAKAGWYPFGPGYIQTYTTNPWFEDQTLYIKTRR